VTHHGHGVLRACRTPSRRPAYHSLIIDEATLPPELAVTARTDASRWPSATAPADRGVQFHPESILTTHGSMIIARFVAAAARAQAS